MSRRARRPSDPPILLPPAPRPEGPLPRVVPLLAFLGVLILLVCTLPAVRSQQDLERRHARLLERTQAAEERVKALRRELRRGAHQAYLKTKATHELLHRGGSYITDRDRKLGR